MENLGERELYEFQYMSIKFLIFECLKLILRDLIRQPHPSRENNARYPYANPLSRYRDTLRGNKTLLFLLELEQRERGEGVALQWIRKLDQEFVMDGRNKRERERKRQ